jgi:hypothetical protein
MNSGKSTHIINHNGLKKIPAALFCSGYFIFRKEESFDFDNAKKEALKLFL